MGGQAALSPYQQITTTSKLAPKYEALLGLNANSPEYSPFQALSRQAGAQAKMIEGMTTRPTWSSMYAAMGVPQGQDLTPYIRAMRQGTSMPIAPIPKSPEAGAIPEYTNPSDTGKVPKKEAAQGGLMSLRRGYAEAGPVKALTAQQQQYVKNISKAIQNGKVTQAQIDRLNAIEKNTGLNVSPYSDVGTGTPKNPTIANLVSKTADTYTKQQADYTKQQADKAPEPPVPLSQAMTQEVPFFAGEEAAKKDQLYGGITNPIYQQALDQLRAASKAPETIGQGAGIMSQAADRLMGMTGYTPEQVQAQQAQAAQYQAAEMRAPENIAAKDYTAAQMDAANVERARDVAAPLAQASTYQAERMAAPQEVRAQGYDAAQMQGALMAGAGNVSANALQQQQLDRNQIQNLQAQQAQVALMGGPESWAQPGVAQAYMNPYVKTALQAQRDIANRAYAQDLQRTQAEAAGKGAFGGSRTQLALTQQRMNQDLASRATEAQALSQAYTQGMGQFTNEQQMAQTAKSANQSAQNAAYLNYVAQKLAADQANQGMDYNTALQNMQAKLGVQQAQQQADLQASLANQQYGLGGFQSQTQNLASQNQAAAANMAALNQQRSQYVAQALQAAQSNQQAGLTTEQQNMIAQNAASQFNAQNQQQISQLNAQMSLAAQQANQQADLSTNQLSAQLRQQSSAANQAAINQQRSQYVAQALQAAQTNYGGQLTTAQQNQVAQNAANQFNAQSQNQISLANQQAGLQAAIQNQQAGLTAQGLNLQALNQAGQMGQGLGGLGISTWNAQQNIPQLWGAAGQTVQNIAQQAANAKQQTGINWWGGMANTYQPVTNLTLGAAGQQGTQTTNRLPGT